MSKVMSNGNGRDQVPDQRAGRRATKKSQIEEYLDFYGGPGVQHIAVATDDIIATVRGAARRAAWSSSRMPAHATTTSCTARVGEIDEADRRRSRELGILVDRDDEGYLLQIFTKPVQDRPTLFFEIIQRKGAKSFGKGNFKALFESHRARAGAARQPVSRRMPIYHTLGEIPRKRHIVFRKPDGGLYAEELIGHRGLHRDRRRCSTTCTRPPRCKSVRAGRGDAVLGGRRRHLAAAPALPHGARSRAAASPTLDRIPLLFNNDIAMLYVRAGPGRTSTSTATRRATRWSTSREGEGVLESLFGDLPYRAGRLPGDPPRHPAPLPLHAKPAKLPRDGEPRPRAARRRATATSRAAARGRALLRARHPAPRELAARIDEKGEFPIWSSSTTRSTSSCSTTIRSTWSAGTATSIRGRSTSTTSSRSSGASTSRRRCTRPSRATAS